MSIICRADTDGAKPKRDDRIRIFPFVRVQGLERVGIKELQQVGQVGAASLLRTEL
jgi:hypothetical protein